MGRRHKLHSEASYRFERGVDRELPLRATAKAVALLSGLGGGQVVPGCTHASVEVPPVLISMAADYPDRVAGVVYGRDTVVRRLREVGCSVRQTREARPTVAPWRAERPGDRSRPRPRALVPRARGHPAVLAARPDRPGRPGRGGHPAGRLRERPGPDAPRAGRARAHAAAAAAPLGGPDAGRGRVRGGAVVAVRVAVPTRTCSGCRPRTCAARRWRWPTRSARTSRCCAPPCCPACSGCWPGTSGGGSPTRRCSRSAWCSGPGPGRAASAPDPRRWTAGPRWPNSPPWKPPCPTSRCGSARCWPASVCSTAGGARGARRPGRTRSRRPARSAGSAGCRSTSAPTSTRPGIRGAARPSTSRSRTPTARGSGWPGTPANCIRG